AFVRHDPIEHALDLVHRTMGGALGSARREAGRATQVAVVGDLQDADAAVLLVIGADPAVVRTPVSKRGVVPLDLFGVLEEDLAARAEILDVVGEEHALLAVLRAALPQVDLVALDELLRVAQDE